MNFKSKQNAFSLIELLIYIAIFSIVAGLMTGILTMVLKVNQKESAFAETTSQLNFVMQTIGRLVRESSNIEMATSTATSTLRLRMKDSAGGSINRDPIVIWLDAPSQIIKMSEGTGASQRISDLTDDKVIADKLLFTKFSQYPGHDTVSIDIQLTYNSTNPNSRITRALQSAIARVSAATFDSDLLPGSGYTFSIGQSGSAWQRIFMSDGFSDSPSYTFSGNPTTGIFVPSTNALGFSTAGVNRMIINNLGNVGIGTEYPTRKLQLHESSAAASVLKITNDITGGSSNEGFDLGVIQNTGEGMIWNRENTDIRIATNNLEVMRIQASGNVGIGTTGPASKLHIQTGIDQNIKFSPFVNGSNGTALTASNDNPVNKNNFEIIANDILLTPTGNVGIGTASPQAKLDISGGNGSTLLRIVEGGSGGGFPLEVIAPWGSQPSLVVTNSGNVGIGTASPQAKLEVNGNTIIRNGNLYADLQEGWAFAICHSSNGAQPTQMFYDCVSGPSADYAEMYPVELGIEPGDIVAPGTKITTTKETFVSKGGQLIPILIKTTQQYQNNILGIVSDPATATDFNVIGYNIKDIDNPMPVALVGRVSTNVSNQNGTIAVGDFITSSDIPGVGMKASSPGRVVGIALESFDGSKGATCGKYMCGKILVFVNVNDGNMVSKLDSLKAEIEQLKQIICLDHPKKEVCKK